MENHPFEVLSVFPRSDQLIPICEGRHAEEFRVAIWDPDEADESSFRATLDYRESAYGEDEWTSWIVNCQPQTVALDKKRDGQGVQLEFSCALSDVEWRAGVSMIRVRLSDRGFIGDREPVALAQTAQAIWTVAVTRKTECESEL